jgi:hypothetical protein
MEQKKNNKKNKDNNNNIDCEQKNPIIKPKVSVLRVKIADYNYFPQVISGAGRQ